MDPSTKAIVALPRAKITGLNMGAYRIQAFSEKYTDVSGWSKPWDFLKNS